MYPLPTLKGSSGIVIIFLVFSGIESFILEDDKNSVSCPKSDHSFLNRSAEIWLKHSCPAEAQELETGIDFTVASLDDTSYRLQQLRTLQNKISARLSNVYRSSAGNSRRDLLEIKDNTKRSIRNLRQESPRNFGESQRRITTQRSELRREGIAVRRDLREKRLGTNQKQQNYLMKPEEALHKMRESSVLDHRSSERYPTEYRRTFTVKNRNILPQRNAEIENMHSGEPKNNFEGRDSSRGRREDRRRSTAAFASSGRFESNRDSSKVDKMHFRMRNTENLRLPQEYSRMGARSFQRRDERLRRFGNDQRQRENFETNRREHTRDRMMREMRSVLSEAIENKNSISTKRSNAEQIRGTSRRSVIPEDMSTRKSTPRDYTRILAEQLNDKNSREPIKNRKHLALNSSPNNRKNHRVAPEYRSFLREIRKIRDNRFDSRSNERYVSTIDDGRMMSNIIRDRRMNRSAERKFRDTIDDRRMNKKTEDKLKSSEGRFRDATYAGGRLVSSAGTVRDRTTIRRMPRSYGTNNGKMLRNSEGRFRYTEDDEMTPRISDNEFRSITDDPRLFKSHSIASIEARDNREMLKNSGKGSITTRFSSRERSTNNLRQSPLNRHTAEKSKSLSRSTNVRQENISSVRRLSVRQNMRSIDERRMLVNGGRSSNMLLAEERTLNERRNLGRSRETIISGREYAERIRSLPNHEKRLRTGRNVISAGRSISRDVNRVFEQNVRLSNSVEADIFKNSPLNRFDRSLRVSEAISRYSRNMARNAGDSSDITRQKARIGGVMYSRNQIPIEKISRAGQPSKIIEKNENIRSGERRISLYRRTFEKIDLRGNIVHNRFANIDSMKDKNERNILGTNLRDSDYKRKEAPQLHYVEDRFQRNTQRNGMRIESLRVVSHLLPRKSADTPSRYQRLVRNDLFARAIFREKGIAEKINSEYEEITAISPWFRTVQVTMAALVLGQFFLFSGEGEKNRLTSMNCLRKLKSF